MILYIVSDGATSDRLIEATSRAQAIRYAAQHYTARVAKPIEVGQLMQAGVKIEKAVPEQTELPA